MYKCLLHVSQSVLALWNYYLAPIPVQTWNKLLSWLCVCIGCCTG